MNIDVNTVAPFFLCIFERYVC